MVHRKHSWTIVDSSLAIKRTDLSVFKNRGSEIPIDIRKFFDIEELVPGDTIIIKLLFRGKEYRGRLSRVTTNHKVTRLFWNVDLHNEFNKLFPDVLQTEDYPELYFTKVDSLTYLIEFFVPEFYEKSECFSKQIGISNENALKLENEVHIKVGDHLESRFYSTKYELDPEIRKRAISIHGVKCMACGFDFEKIYGIRGSNFIELHHIVPLSSKDESIEVDPSKDIICVCSNCHRMIHRSIDKVLTLEELKNYLTSTK